jgi:gp32-like DNA binding protein
MPNIIKAQGTWDPEQAEADLREASKASTEFLKPKDGANALRFLPPMEGQTTPFVIVYQHWITKPDGTRTNVNCPRLMSKLPCPGCDRVDELQRTGNPADFAAAKEMRASMRVHANVIDRDAEEAGVQVFAFGKQILNALVEIRKNARAGGDFMDVEDGFDIIVNKGKRAGTDQIEYTVLAARESTPLSSDDVQAAQWLESRVNLERFKMLQEYDALIQVFEGSALPPVHPRQRVTSGGTPRGQVLPAPRNAREALARQPGKPARTVADDMGGVDPNEPLPF